MLGERGPQRGLFEADSQYLDFVGRDSFYGWLGLQRGSLFRDEDFAGLYCTANGRPSVPPSLLATALVLQTYDRVSDEEAKRRADYDLRWKVALGIGIDERPFAKSTLQEFRAQLIVHQQQAVIFGQSLEQAKRQGSFQGKRKLRPALDTTIILGQGAVKDTYNLLGDGIAAVVRVVARQAGMRLVAWAEREGYGRYVAAQSLKGQAELAWENPQARRSYLAGIVADADRLLEQVRQARSRLTAGSPEEQALVTAAGLLSRVLVQDIERRQDGPDLRQGVARDRMPSLHDPEVRHGRKSAAKRFDGHKAAIAVDTETQLITAVAVLAGNAPDHDGALTLVAQTEAATGLPVHETVADCAYGDGTTRQAFADANRTLIAKVAAVTNQGRFPKTAFALDLAQATCSCPAGQVSTDLRRRAAGGGVFHFAQAVCGPCPLRAQCVRGQRGRTVQLHPQEGLLQAARQFQASPAYRAYRRLRQVVEHRLARLAQLGIHQARYRGRAKTLFQLCMTAAVANLTLLAAQHGQQPALPHGFAAAALLAGLLIAFWDVLAAPPGSCRPSPCWAILLPISPRSTYSTPGSRPDF